MYEAEANDKNRNQRTVIVTGSSRLNNLLRTGDVSLTGAWVDNCRHVAMVQPFAKVPPGTSPLCLRWCNTSAGWLGVRTAAGTYGLHRGSGCVELAIPGSVSHGLDEPSRDLPETPPSRRGWPANSHGRRRGGGGSSGRGDRRAQRARGSIRVPFGEQHAAGPQLCPNGLTRTGGHLFQ